MFVAPTLKFVALGLLLIPISVHARRPAPVPCNPGTFAVGIANQEGLAAIVGTKLQAGAVSD